VWVKLGWSTSGADKYSEIMDISANFMESNVQKMQKLTIAYDS
jgi:hypothetical protein